MAAHLNNYILVILSGPALATLYSISVIIYNLFFHPLRKYPGTWLESSTRIPYVLAKYHGIATFRSRELHNKYGHIVRIAPDTLSFTSSQAWSDIYGPRLSDMRGNIPRDPTFVAGSPDSFGGASDENHRRLRRISSFGFSENSIALQHNLLQRHTTAFISRVREESSRSGGVDVVRWMNVLTTDIVGELAFGETFGGLETGELHPWLNAIFKSIKLVYLMCEMNRLPFWLTRLALKALPRKTREQMDKIRSFAAEAVQKRAAEGTEKSDLLSNLVKQKENGNLSDDELRETAAAFIVAGGETIATLLSACLYLLGKNPHVMGKITGMIRSDFASPSDMAFAKLQNHEYLTAVLLEALRLYPPIPDSLFRRTNKPAVVLGEVIPPNISLTVNLWAANRSANYFYRPEEFIPERWLKNCPAQFAGDDRAVSKPFSFGPRDCLGKTLAWAEMRLILSNILWHLDVELLAESQDWIDDSKIFLWWEKPQLQMKFKSREWK